MSLKIKTEPGELYDKEHKSDQPIVNTNIKCLFG